MIENTNIKDGMNCNFLMNDLVIHEIWLSIKIISTNKIEWCSRRKMYPKTQ